MAKRLAILSCLILAALFAGLLGARMLGGPFISPDPQDSRATTERFALGRDIYRQEDYAVETRYDPYRPGAGSIASPSVPGARAIEPYRAARPDHRATFDSEDGNFMEATGLPEDAYAVIDPPAPSRPNPPPSGAQPSASPPENLLPGGYVRSERPTYPKPEPAGTGDTSAPPVTGSGDPVADTERRIMNIAGGRAAPRGAEDRRSDTLAPPGDPSLR